MAGGWVSAPLGSPGSGPGAWRRDRPLVAKSRHRAVTLPQDMRPPDLHHPISADLMVLLRNGVVGLHTPPRTCSHLLPDGPTGRTRGHVHLGQTLSPCPRLAERSGEGPGGGRLAPGREVGGGWLGVLCKHPSGSVRFRAVTPLPVSPRPTVTEVAAAGCGRQGGGLVLGTAPAELQGCGRKAL